MKAKILWVFAAAALLPAAAAAAAAPAAAQQLQADTAAARPFRQSPLFAGTSTVEFTLVAPFRDIRGDREEKPPWRDASIEYRGDSGEVSVPVRVRTRGIWRKANCEMPPISLNFKKDSVKRTLFAHLDRARLSVHCRDNDRYEQYVLQEYALYRVQRLLTPMSFDARLARVTYLDAEKHDTVATRYAFLTEQDESFADRVGLPLVELKGAGPRDLDPYESAFFGVFQFFVGNSDYSIRSLHNVVLVYREPAHIPVARDFDWSGAVNARYARPNPVLKIRSVRQRVMRGYCAPAAEYEKVFEVFRAKKDAIYSVYRDSLASLLDPDVVGHTIEYFDEFYKVIDDPRSAKREIIDACLDGSA